MRGTFRVKGRVARMTLRIEVEAPSGGADVTDVMLQPGGNASGWLPHVTELPWSAGVS
ncbi:hypothetical protein K8F61_17075 [Microbacterium resistens]|uniref:Uncharacterized protein n=1 Tax=Microbacterium resistens TaxID=156977 RepID=A0ABY3RV36_9MICO|nr:hypothetical protein [Microbacterium resistens]UGS26317.1 hypothetical protein K8F61_17075 [Microbacterium resistens]